MDKKVIHYQVIGSGYPLVFLHGNMEDSSIFLNQINDFKNDYQLILIDTIMHGKSNHSYQKYSFFDLAKDVLNILEKEKINQANFIGFSDGANILFHLALLNQTIINKGVCISGNLNPRGFKLPSLIHVKLKTVYYKITKNNNYYFYYLMSKNPSLKYRDLRKIKSNLLILAGSKDVIRNNHTIKISTNLVNAKLALIKDFDHFAIINNSVKLNKIIKDYFT